MRLKGCIGSLRGVPDPTWWMLLWCPPQINTQALSLVIERSALDAKNSAALFLFPPVFLKNSHYVIPIHGLERAGIDSRGFHLRSTQFEVGRPMTPLSQKANVRSITFFSSRTFPGHSYRHISASASGEKRADIPSWAEYSFK